LFSASFERPQQDGVKLIDNEGDRARQQCHYLSHRSCLLQSRSWL
jgi:hypothetical protein